MGSPANLESLISRHQGLHWLLGIKEQKELRNWER